MRPMTPLNVVRSTIDSRPALIRAWFGADPDCIIPNFGTRADIELRRLVRHADDLSKQIRQTARSWREYTFLTSDLKRTLRQLELQERTLRQRLTLSQACLERPGFFSRAWQMIRYWAAKALRLGKDDTMSANTQLLWENGILTIHVAVDRTIRHYQKILEARPTIGLYRRAAWMSDPTRRVAS